MNLKEKYVIINNKKKDFKFLDSTYYFKNKKNESVEKFYDIVNSNLYSADLHQLNLSHLTTQQIRELKIQKMSPLIRNTYDYWEMASFYEDNFNYFQGPNFIFFKSSSKLPMLNYADGEINDKNISLAKKYFDKNGFVWSYLKSNNKKNILEKNGFELSLKYNEMLANITQQKIKKLDEKGYIKDLTVKRCKTADDFDLWCELAVNIFEIDDMHIRKCFISFNKQNIFDSFFIAYIKNMPVGIANSFTGGRFSDLNFLGVINGIKNQDKIKISLIGSVFKNALVVFGKDKCICSDDPKNDYLILKECGFESIGEYVEYFYQP